ncbi:hypothetical protein IJK16_00635 [Candidatus Saccharibacteria bacterium]|nr:hypothetical protein [Candidatus Saccharibacteria bacterium]
MLIRQNVKRVWKTTPTRADSGTFLGWSDGPTAVTPTYLPGDDYITESVSSTLYAIWE